MILNLTNELIFPNPALAEEDGLLAVGGDLSKERLILAYENGIFPWFNEENPILWYSPHVRCVIFPEEIKISKSMKKVLNSKKFTVTYNQAFEKVIEACAYAKRLGQDGTWITNNMQQAYLDLHRFGYAHSIEVWENKELVGGLYGVLINRVFCGESMFSKKSNASKTALIWLCQNANIKLIDCQIYAEHLESLGARMISREEFMRYLT
ncbi:MAG: leucyl/phenylalanyl-tRNA--protein transferase [Bacteroidetes bacterium]|nr:leucyl/phenylalanyl-tRNA--protein transferase [Bacteroidota bacterium]MBU1373971.1 leucyl/phenylalanyl-tRNA--protein transferase [Bacteroidota bacterium]MBU1485301.1 leucyl/phenylalanyl-tRNA--protein transferase [Bacteroidota bacterium]MBU1760115.1 leucyl/phenylalanyl-tRNA--protein transferase [Bacteroidota bacterium]MBU2269050.1 leucyl/phenylalanyl-tRNA--protein transferase [Bacteroidota bacterium]